MHQQQWNLHYHCCMKPVCHTVTSIFNKILWLQLYSLNCNESEFHYWDSLYGWKRLMHSFWASKEVTRVNQKVKAIFKLCGNRDREELPHCAVLTMPVEEFSHVQYSALPLIEWQQQRRKHGRSVARLHHRRTVWHSAVSLGRRSESCGNSPSYVGSVWTEHHESTKGLWVGGKF